MKPYSVTKNTDVEGTIVGTLLQRLRKPRIEGIAKAIAAEAQSVEDAAYQLLTEINLDVGVGAQLDLIGKLLRVPRRLLTDDTYKVRLRVEILLNRSAGTIDDVLSVVRAASALVSDAVYSLDRPSPATIEVSFEGTVTDAFLSELWGFLNRARGLGIALILVFGETDAFTLGDDADGEIEDTTHGWGDSDNVATGGKLRGIVSE